MPEQISYSQMKDIFIRLSCEQLNISYLMYTKHMEQNKDKALEILYEKMDSLDKLEFVTRLETEFNITISDADLNNFKSIEDMFNYICAKQNISVPQKTVAPTAQQITAKKMSFIQKAQNMFSKQK